MREIQLTQGKVALVDDEDFEYLSQWKWFASRSPKTWYVLRHGGHRPDGSRETTQMHVVVMRPPRGLTVDHRNWNGLDNQRSNLRVATATQQAQNRRQRLDSNSGFKGVSWRSETNKWRARITVDGNLVSLGSFTDPTEAARIYDEAALQYFGEFAILNFQERT